MLLRILAICLTFALAACGGGDGGATDAPATTAGITLGQSFSAADEGIPLQFQYPDGWVAAGVGGQVAVANSLAVFDLIESGSLESMDLPDDGYGLQLQLLPAAEMPPDTTPASLLEMLAEGASGEGVTVGDPESVQVNGQAGARASMTMEQGSGEIYLFPNGEYFVMMIAAASSYDSHRATTEAIAQSVQTQ